MEALLTHPIKWVREFAKICIEEESDLVLDQFNNYQIWISNKHVSLYIVGGNVKIEFISFSSKTALGQTINEDFKIETPPRYIFQLYKIKNQLIQYRYRKSWAY